MFENGNERKRFKFKRGKSIKRVRMDRHLRRLQRLEKRLKLSVMAMQVMYSQMKIQLPMSPAKLKERPKPKSSNVLKKIRK